MYIGSGTFLAHNATASPAKTKRDGPVKPNGATARYSHILVRQKTPEPPLPAPPAATSASPATAASAAAEAAVTLRASLVDVDRTPLDVHTV